MKYRFGVGRRHCLWATGVVLLVVGTTSSAQQSTETYTYDVLGRLFVADTSGGQNNNESHSVCYDKADNRATYKAVSDGSTAACVDIGVVTGSPDPDPDPDPEPTNSPPVATNDSATVYCNTSATINLTANDSDPDGNLPLQIKTLTKTSGSPISSSIVSASSVSITAYTRGTRVFTYSVEDTLGASDTGQLTVTVPLTGCTN